MTNRTDKLNQFIEELKNDPDILAVCLYVETKDKRYANIHTDPETIDFITKAIIANIKGMLALEKALPELRSDNA
jgi:hypothetical protein